MTDRPPRYHRKTILVAIGVLIALAVSVIILGFGLTRMLGNRKRPEQVTTVTVQLASGYDSASAVPPSKYCSVELIVEFHGYLRV